MSKTIKTKLEQIPPPVSPDVAVKKKKGVVISPYVCPICGEVWQPKDGNKGKDRLRDFPRIGCSSNTCPGC